ncbi:MULTISPECIES: beta-phosphoglucomutase [unclassified Facklamia]|uniref:beta-phosphoglucomutase n=1 Tax=Aerococcaceae TaxID=186827 RepID=UPI00193863C5|nr:MULTISPECIES: beta-phosphoglucomutase [unclassified Facklamia]QQD65419.1 beta-phosphoglucomutase [Aerococcaceae bacterium zg-252]
MKGALFDLDGVIADTAVYHFAAWRNLVKKHFNAELPDELEEKTKGVSREDSLKVILDYLNIELDEDVFDNLAEEKNDAYVKALDALTEKDILPGISQLLIELKNHSVKLALASASKNGPLILEKLGLSNQFDAIADPSKVANGKPAPDIFLAAAHALGLNPADCIGVEDSVAGVTAINAAGSVSIATGGSELDHAHKRFDSTADLNFKEIEDAWVAFHK